MSKPDEMADLIGTLGKFDPRTETVSCYEERSLLYLTANNTADENAGRRKAIFLSEVGRDIYQVLSDLCSPDKVASKTLDQLLKKLNQCLMIYHYTHRDIDWFSGLI